MTTTSAFQLSANDTINYKIYVAKAVPMTDVNVKANLELMVSNRDENPDVDSRILGALRDFIDTDWTLLEQQSISATPSMNAVH